MPLTRLDLSGCVRRFDAQTRGSTAGVRGDDRNVHSDPKGIRSSQLLGGGKGCHGTCHRFPTQTTGFAAYSSEPLHSYVYGSTQHWTPVIIAVHMLSILSGSSEVSSVEIPTSITPHSLSTRIRVERHRSSRRMARSHNGRERGGPGSRLTGGHALPWGLSWRNPWSM